MGKIRSHVRPHKWPWSFVSMRVKDALDNRHMPKTIVTGGAGFIGSHNVENLIQQGHQVVELDALSGGFVENVGKGARLVRGSINDPGLINTLFRRERFDYVYHLAAYAAEG